MHQEMSAGIAEEDQEAEKQSLDGNHSGWLAERALRDESKD